MRNRTLSVFRALALGALLLVSVRAEESKKSYDLAVGDAAATLKQFAEISGRETLFAAEIVRGVKTQPVKGTLTAQEALDALLADTGLFAARDAKTGAFAVRKGESPNAPRADQMASVRPGQVTKAEDGTVEMGEYEVTGSRIRGLLGEADFSPMVRFERREIEQLGIFSMGELSRLIPQAFSQGSYEGVGFGGQQQGTVPTSDGSIASVLTQRTNINLRGLGAANTLVLINGRRMARSGNIRGSDGYDLTGIPIAAVERIEVVTDGSSAIYGSDAVGGVINIILRKNYSGTEATLSYAAGAILSTYGDPGRNRLVLLC